MSLSLTDWLAAAKARQKFCHQPPGLFSYTDSEAHKHCEADLTRALAMLGYATGELADLANGWDERDCVAATAALAALDAMVEAAPYWRSG